MSDTLRVPLVYIAGSSHSGSTLIDLVIGSHTRIESLGEAKKIPKILGSLQSGFQPKPVCSCHAPIVDCDFWKSALQFETPDYSQRERITFDSSADLAMARRALAFRNKSVLLDSSKNLGRLGFLAQEAGFSTTCLHLTRDPRAVAFSAIRKMERADGATAKNRMRLVCKHALDWSALNQKIRRRYRKKSGLSYLHLRYEDFVFRHEASLSKVLQILDLEFEPAQVRFRDFTHHNIEGNRLRLQSDSDIKFDSGYLKELTPSEWLTSSLLLLPTLSRFGYCFSRKDIFR